MDDDSSLVDGSVFRGTASDTDGILLVEEATVQ